MVGKDFDLSLFWGERGVASSWRGQNVSFNTTPPDWLRTIQHPSLSIFFLFTSRFMSLHANSITGIKIVCPIHPQTLLPLSFPSLNPSHHLQAFRSQSWVRGLQDKHAAAEHPKKHRAAVLKNVPMRSLSISES